MMESVKSFFLISKFPIPKSWSPSPGISGLKKGPGCLDPGIRDPGIAIPMLTVFCGIEI